MKPTTTSKTICALFTSLLVASTSVLAQVAPPTPAQAAGPAYFSDGDSFALPKTSGPNFYLEGGLAYMNAKIGLDQDNSDLWGAHVAFGWRIDKHSKIQVEMQALFSSDDYYASYGGYSGKITQEVVAVPTLFSYSYCLPLDKNGQWELHFTPTVGFYTANMKLKGSIYGYGSASDDDTDTSFVFGGGVGFTYHINKNLYLDLSYRYMRAGSTDYQLFGTSFDQDAFNANGATFSIGWKF
ncbi:outer membrane beta-barrel protein [Ereboglobus luteus]|uniref:Outer membrane protein beta-barrel domain-containing protein n=1 Tax=Ereboglobus luteus TaxID=1796921 RepID=A0A2U8E001_9BACT|nr:outer membrane beta-barrel protein [Ereboglobus luteus]AWI07902.1 hypothetical protein CKA38_00285 [Ereboglobus luteus]